MLLTYGPPHASDGTFAAAELYQTDGFGQNRDGRRGSVMAQYEGGSGATRYRITGQAYISSFHTAGVMRDDDYHAGRIGFYGTYDPLQGEDASRYSVAVELEHKSGNVTAREPGLRHRAAAPAARELHRLSARRAGAAADAARPARRSPRPRRHGGHRRRARLRAPRRPRAATSCRRSRSATSRAATSAPACSSASKRRRDTPTTPTRNLDSRLGDIGLYVDVNLRSAALAGAARRRARRPLHLRRARQLRGAVGRAPQSEPAARRTELLSASRTSAPTASPTSAPRRCRRRTCRAAR